MFDSEIHINRFLVGYCRMLMGELTDEQMTLQPLPGVNHPAWILGHLAFSADLIVFRLGGQKAFDEAWAKQFGPGSQMTANRADYPAKKLLLATVEKQFEIARTLAESAMAEQCAQPNPNVRLKEALPTVRDAVAFLLTGHLGVHLGQLSSWRRMIGLPPMF